MKRLMSCLSSWCLTVAVLVVLTASILSSVKIMTDLHALLIAGEKGYVGGDQAEALANVIEQYRFDFPDAGPLGNAREWTDRLGGHNAKGIRYLKVEKFGPDVTGRLLDLCGAPWIIEVPGDPG